MPLVEQQGQGGVGRHLHGGLPLQKGVFDPRPFLPPDGLEPLGPLFHQGNGAGHQNMIGNASVALQAQGGPARFAFPGGYKPGLIGPWLHPVPEVGVGVEFFPGPHHVVGVQVGGQGGVRIVFEDLPPAVGIDNPFGPGIPLQNKAGLNGMLGHRAVAGKIPDRGRHHILARLQVRGQVEGLIPPVEPVAPGRAKGDVLPVHVELVAVVGRDVHHKCLGRLVKAEFLPEVVDAEFPTRVVGVGDPFGGPLVVQFGVDPVKGLGISGLRQQQHQAGKEGKKVFHNKQVGRPKFGPFKIAFLFNFQGLWRPELEKVRGQPCKTI